MPSTSKLLLWLVFPLVARCAKAKGKVAFVCRSTVYATWVFFGPLLERMFFTVSSGGNYDKVLKPVILRVSVFVVYVQSFWRTCHDTVLILPLVGLRNFYAHIDQPISGFVKFFCANWQRHSDFVQHLPSRSFSFWREGFVCAVRASRRVVVSVAVRPLFAYDLSIAKRAQFERKFFGHEVFYTKHNRIANAF
jgi:hypothetical protein